MGKRFLFDHHDLSPEMYQAKFGSSGGVALAGLRYLERKTFETADLIVTTNQSHRRIAVERGGKAPGDVYVVRSGPDLERLTVHPPDPAWRNGKRHLLVYLGEICRQDGVDHLVRALKLLRDELGRDDVHCVLVGSGPHQPTIRSSADLGVDPHPKNAWSDRSTMNKIMEYMFFGLPIVASDLTEHRVSAGPAALFAEPNREPALAGCIVELLDDPARRLQLGQAGRQRVRSVLAWEHSARCCWPPTTGSGRRPAAAASSIWTRRPGPDRARQRSHLGTGRDVQGTDGILEGGRELQVTAGPATAPRRDPERRPRVTSSPVAPPPSRSVSECTSSTRRATAMTSTYPPASQGTSPPTREDVRTIRTTSTATRAAAVARARWPDGYRSSGPPGHWRCTSCLSTVLTRSVPGTATMARTRASHRSASQATAAPATVVRTATGSTVPEMIAATRWPR